MTLDALNGLDKKVLKETLATCCGSTSWVERMAARFPITHADILFENAEKIWFSCEKKDWIEAFEHHPKIGDLSSLRKKFFNTAHLASNEQAAISKASKNTMEELAKLNEAYEIKFGFIFIVCATGKSAEEMLRLIQLRMNNSKNKELENAMEEQNKITLLRLKKILL